MLRHCSEYLLEITQLRLRLQDQIISNRELLVALGGSPESINTLASLPKAENDLFSISVLSEQINNGISAVNASL